jgi:hypothetical protein
MFIHCCYIKKLILAESVALNEKALKCFNWKSDDSNAGKTVKAEIWGGFEIYLTDTWICCGGDKRI